MENWTFKSYREIITLEKDSKSANLGVFSNHPKYNTISYQQAYSSAYDKVRDATHAGADVGGTAMQGPPEFPTSKTEAAVSAVMNALNEFSSNQMSGSNKKP